MKNRYPVKIEKENMGYAAGVNLGISSKVSIEISNWIRGKPLERAKVMLEQVINMKEAVPYRRFNKDVGHKPAIGPGRYPVKASSELLGLIKSAESNAIDKGLNPADLFIFHISADRAAQQWKYGRQRRRKAKRTNIKIVLKEAKSSKTSSADSPKSSSKKETGKPIIEEKQSVPKEIPKKKEEPVMQEKVSPKKTVNIPKQTESPDIKKEKSTEIQKPKEIPKSQDKNKK